MKRSIGLRAAQVLVTSTVVVALTALTACSSDDSNSGDATVSSAEAPSDAFPGKTASGEPVRIGLINNEGGPAISQPENREAAVAAAAYANENLGGIGGRPIELVICKEQEEPVSARDCANQMVEQKVSAVVVTSSGFGTIMAPIITAAGIPYTSAVAGSVAETNTDLAYVWSSGANTAQALGVYAGEQGVKNAVAFAIDVPAAVGSLQMLGEPAFTANGSKLKVVPIPLGTPDATPQVSAGLDSDPGAVVIYGESTVCTSVMKSLATLGSTAEKWTVQACAAPEVVDSVGSGLDGTKIFSVADVSSEEPESVLFRDVMDKYSPDTPTTGYAVTGYQGVLGLVRATQSVVGTDTSPAAINTAIKSAKDVVLPAGDGITFTCDGQAITGFKSVCGNQLIVLTIEDGKQSDPKIISIGS